MKIIKVDNSDDVAIVISTEELKGLHECIGHMPQHEYIERGASSESTRVIQPFYNTVSNYFGCD